MPNFPSAMSVKQLNNIENKITTGPLRNECPKEENFNLYDNIIYRSTNR